MEIWKNIPGYEGLYQASNLGQIKSLKREWKCGQDKKSNRIHEEIIIKLDKLYNGYLRVTLCKNLKKKRFLVHRLILKIFIGDSDLYCNHKNGIKSDNRLENLEWVTASENTKHAYNSGFIKINKGEDSHNSKLKESQILRIKTIFKNIKIDKKYVRKIAKSLNVSYDNIMCIINNKSWRHINVS